MSNIKSLQSTLQHAVKVEVVSSCVWSHTEPYANIATYEGEAKFVNAALDVAKQKSEHIFTSIFVTTKEHGWMHRFDATKAELTRLAAYEFVKSIPSMLAKAYGVHSNGFAQVTSDEKKEAARKMLGAYELDFHRHIELGITEFRNESCSKDDPIVESSTVADSFDSIDDTKQNS